MSGLKSCGQVVGNITTKGVYNPQETSINFAVPRMNALQNYDIKTDIPKEILLE